MSAVQPVSESANESITMTNQSDSELIFEDKIVNVINEHDGSILTITVIYVVIATILFLLYGIWDSKITDWTRLAQVLIGLLLIITVALFKLRQITRRKTMYRQFFIDYANNTLIATFTKHNDAHHEEAYDLAQLSRLVEKKHRGSTALYLKFGIRGDGLWITQISPENKARIKMVLREHIGKSRWIKVDFEAVLKAKADGLSS